VEKGYQGYRGYPGNQGGNIVIKLKRLLPHKAPSLRARVEGKLARMRDGRLDLPRENRILFNCTKGGKSATAIAEQMKELPRILSHTDMALDISSTNLGSQLRAMDAAARNVELQISAQIFTHGEEMVKMIAATNSPLADGQFTSFDFSGYLNALPQFSKFPGEIRARRGIESGLPYSGIFPDWINGPGISVDQLLGLPAIDLKYPDFKRFLNNMLPEAPEEKR
jgi:hypothetical protein